MKKVFITISALAIALSAFYAIANEKKHTTIQSCADLLPAGHNFTVTINANVDTNHPERKMTGEFSISDDSMKNDSELDKKLETFKSCAVKIIK